MLIAWRLPCEAPNHRSSFELFHIKRKQMPLKEYKSDGTGRSHIQTGNVSPFYSITGLYFSSAISLIARVQPVNMTAPQKSKIEKSIAVRTRLLGATPWRCKAKCMAQGMAANPLRFENSTERKNQSVTPTASNMQEKTLHVLQ